MAKEDIKTTSELAQRVYEFIVKNGNQASQTRLRTDIGITPEQYIAVRGELLGKGFVVPYQCYSGGIRVIDDTAPELPPSDIEKIATAKNQEIQQEAKFHEEKTEEKALYPAVEQWANNSGFMYVANVADSHGRPSWENPDIIAINQYELQWLAGSHIEITSIEVKLSFTVTAIWQAAHYRKFSHFVYLACFENETEMRNSEEGRLYRVCSELGLGVISLSSSGYAGKGVKCSEINSPARHNPSIEDVDAFLCDYSQMLPKLQRPGCILVGQIAQAQSGVK